MPRGHAAIDLRALMFLFTFVSARRTAALTAPQGAASGRRHALCCVATALQCLALLSFDSQSLAFLYLCVLAAPTLRAR